MPNKSFPIMRMEIKYKLKFLPDDCVFKFKMMYAFDNFELPIDEMVDEIPNDKLEWALKQINNTKNKNKGI